MQSPYSTMLEVIEEPQLKKLYAVVSHPDHVKYFLNPATNKTFPAPPNAMAANVWASIKATFPQAWDTFAAMEGIKSMSPIGASVNMNFGVDPTASAGLVIGTTRGTTPAGTRSYVPSSSAGSNFNMTFGVDPTKTTGLTIGSATVPPTKKAPGAIKPSTPFYKNPWVLGGAAVIIGGAAWWWTRYR